MYFVQLRIAPKTPKPRHIKINFSSLISYLFLKLVLKNTMLSAWLWSENSEMQLVKTTSSAASSIWLNTYPLFSL